jgi:hypothetical protein
MAAVGGDHVTHALLAAAVSLDDATLTSALRPAVAAESARADGRQDLAAWDAAHAAWERLGQPYPAAYALLHAARAAIAAGHRDAAAARLRAAGQLAG